MDDVERVAQAVERTANSIGPAGRAGWLRGGAVRSVAPGGAAPAAVLLALLLGACAGSAGAPPPAATFTPEQARQRIARGIPADTADRAGWAADIQTAFALLGQSPTPQAACAVIAVIGQESGFRTDPAVPGLGRIAWQAIEQRAGQAGVPMPLVRAALSIDSTGGRSYAQRIDMARTERELSETFDDLIGRVPLGRQLFGRYNPVRTGGPMQVSVAFAEQYAQTRRYPYPDARPIRDEVFSRRGGLYFGMAHLLDYPAHYDRMLYRFADYNAGRHASRNAAFQKAVGTLAGAAVRADGDLLSGGPFERPGQTEAAVRVIAPRLGLEPRAVRRDLERADQPEFEDTPTWQRVMAAADQRAGAAVPRAVLPDIDLHSPKITRSLTTAWFAQRVDERHARCLERIGSAS